MENLLQSDIKSTYFKYLGAAFGSAMITAIYSMVDAAVVGQYQGPQGSAALSIVMPIWTILYSIGLLVGIGGSVNYAFFKAQDKLDKANAYFTLSLLLVGGIAAACWAGICLFEEPLLRLFGADDALLPLAKEYLTFVKYVVPVYPFSQFFAAFLRNDNAPGKATFAVLFGGVFNVFGDIFFTFDFGLGMGIRGAGLATALGGVLTNLIMLSHFFGKRNTLRLSRVFGHVHKARLVTVNGLSSFVADVSMGIVAMMFNRQVMHYFGADALAVYGVIVQITSAVQCSAYGVGQAAQPLLSANFGAGLQGRIRQTRKYALATTALFGVIWCALMALCPLACVRLFMSPTEAVLQIAPGILRVYGLSYLLLPFNVFATYYFPAVGRARPATVVSLSRGIVVCGILVYTLPALIAPAAVWWVMPITELLVALYVLRAMRTPKAPA